LVTNSDVTSQRRAEEDLQHARADLARVGALTTMGELAASIAHELRQPLAAITMNGSAALRWLNRESPNLDEARDAVSRIVREAQRADEVIRGLRALLGQSGARREPLDLNAAINEVLELVRTESRRNEVSIRTVLDAGLPAAFGDRVQFQQVVLNLILNGIEAMVAVAERPRILVIRTERSESEGAAVIVEDSGPGLDAATVERLFDPFFTTKPNGLGLGLSICRSIVEAHGGRLSASTRASGGTAFRFTVPIAPQGEPAQPTSERQAYA
jgi:C4-dicarboxylate-specific signal transduction histidine kinase